METLLKRYIRDKDTKRPRGVAVVVRDGDEVNYGFSLINARCDKWDRHLGEKIAVARANAEGYNLPEVTERLELVLDAYKVLEKRAKSYFKDLNPDAVEIIQHIECQ